MPIGNQTVPDALLGCWRRNWIQFDESGPDSSVAVIWLQTASGMGDIRIDPTQAPIDTDSSCGITVVDETTTPYMTADWGDGDTGFSQQPVSRFPEKGWLDFRSDTIMHELAPSGAYVEEWERLPDSRRVVEHRVAINAPTKTNLYIAGQHVFLAIERTGTAAVHEFSYGTRPDLDSPAIIELSTLSDRIGQPMNIDTFTWQAISRR